MEPQSRAVRIPSGKVELDADFVPAPTGKGVVLFAHGSGSGRRSPRNREVASRLHAHGFGTLLLDLLSSEEAPVDELTAQYRFNIPLLSERLLAATDWFTSHPESNGVPLGYFGASTGGAVAMIAAAERPEQVAAIVLRGARSDLGDAAARRIRCPVLLLVGEEDSPVRSLNDRTMQRLTCEKKLVVVPGASHLFEEPGALEAVATETVAWFDRHLHGPLGPGTPGVSSGRSGASGGGARR
ncbi:MAG TPA: alpha/beta fold hydrolase [Thermoplasmata archaeon]|nr:alpha/beta fold hydrolase [Thermoplasmata archaeon]